MSNEIPVGVDPLASYAWPAIAEQAEVEHEVDAIHCQKGGSHQLECADQNERERPVPNLRTLCQLGGINFVLSCPQERARCTSCVH
jgi:hypothetical protein